MAIDLPPVIPPQAWTAERVEHAAAKLPVAMYEVGGYSLHITGNRHLSADQLDLLMRNAKTPAQAINAINQAYYQLGHLLTTVYFAQRGDVIYAHVVHGRLADVKAPDSIRGYFSGLIGDDDLRRREFDAQRVLANLKSDRAGMDYSVSYQVGKDPSALTLVLNEQSQQDYDPTEFSFAANNYGNRFLGRYFAGGSVTHNFRNGLEVQFSYDRALTEFGEVNGGDFYDGYTFRLNSPSPWGLYGFEARRVDYARFVDARVQSPDDPLFTLDACALQALCSILGIDDGLIVVGGGTSIEDRRLALEAETTVLALTGEQVLLSDAFYRLTFTQRLEDVDSRIDVKRGQNLLDEPQQSLELGLKYNQLMRLWGLPSKLAVQGFVDLGFKSDSGTLGTDDTEGAVNLGRRSSEFTIFKPRLSFQTSLTERVELTLSYSGQYSDNTQLPLQQQYFLGGNNGLSAYMPGVLVGDSGHYAKATLAAVELPIAGLRFTPAFYVERGEAWFENASGADGDTRMLSDIGVSFRFSYQELMETELVIARPLSDQNIDEEVREAAEADFFWRLRVNF
ncbi:MULTISPECIES: ShlB/FhaC/HecB family hemolysin secretion/activation protein [Spongiibacter]|uniref:ShlB/FhaC/HecB family hemolysin secretion/activation protein n=1 Tax=Spongiibacter TaxID=630749 RepID=UPI002357D579|nr:MULTISPECIES: ShlB/FhaC/HecB family hemolysin secretion/activation protein [Spongiibacter]|tara:strand:- start:19 stop:1713 length:1695 start_codon:yes stop_codon:yes gene_type:complete